MPTLLLLRHAKSSWAEAGKGDFERPLAPRGGRAAPQMGAFIARQKLIPDLVLCSPARRARETLNHVLTEFSAKPEVRYEDDLYHASPSEMIALLRDLEGSPEVVMMVGHNPGFHALALGLSGSGDDEARAEMGSKFPTAALAVIDFSDDWAGIAPDQGKLRLFVTPRGLDHGPATP